ncbi:MAG: aldose 1-epimerase family protein [Sphaerochaetaceae bacterium]
MITLKNRKLTMDIAEMGAEPLSLRTNAEGVEYLWNGDPTYWGSHAPVMFPTIGRTKDDSVEVEGKRYPMAPHGFARKSLFTVATLSPERVMFSLSDSPETRQFYPFAFTLQIIYTLIGDGYVAEARVFNQETDKPLYFSLGWHPAFSLAMNGEGTPMEAYRVTFSQSEHLDRMYATPAGIAGTEKDYLIGDTMMLSSELLSRDSCIFKGVVSREAVLSCLSGPHGVKIGLGDMSTLVIWSPTGKKAPFVCVEPMWTMGDRTRDLELSRMEDLIRLEAGASRAFTNTFMVF